MDYHERAYWERQYKAGNFGEEYEWLGCFDDLVDHIQDACSLPKKVGNNKCVQSEASTPSTSCSPRDGLAEPTSADDAALVTRLSPRSTSSSSGILAATTRSSTTSSSASSSSSPAPRILHLGCGNSSLGVALEDATHCYVLNLDYSGTVINQMKKRYPEHLWKTCDISNPEGSGLDLILMPSTSSSPRPSPTAARADFAVEKGLADALLCEPDEKKKLRSLFIYMQEVAQVLKRDGSARFLLFSLDGDRLLKALAAAGIPPTLELVTRRPVECHTRSENKWLCSLVVFRRIEDAKTKAAGGVDCAKCAKKKLPGVIRYGERCGRCGCLHRGK
ncbi:unnamed protein product [Amoebophrya sp. A25]|nr:unnamed protein product [Amoebophrya sp. A25]|eukprot:GSA25T00011489001.1